MNDESSESDEGFASPPFVAEVEIAKIMNAENIHKEERPIDFQTRYIFGAGLLR